MAAPTTSLGSVTVRKLNSVISALWTKIKNSFAPKDDGLATHDTSKFYRADGTWAAPSFDKVVYIDGTITQSGSSYSVTCSTTFAEVAAMIDPSVGKYPVCRFTLGTQTYYFTFHLGVPSGSSPRYTFGSTDVIKMTGELYVKSYMTCVYVGNDNVWHFEEIQGYGSSYWQGKLYSKEDEYNKTDNVKQNKNSSLYYPSTKGTWDFVTGNRWRFVSTEDALTCYKLLNIAKSSLSESSESTFRLTLGSCDNSSVIRPQTAELEFVKSENSTNPVSIKCSWFERGLGAYLWNNFAQEGLVEAFITEDGDYYYLSVRLYNPMDLYSQYIFISTDDYRWDSDFAPISEPDPQDIVVYTPFIYNILEDSLPNIPIAKLPTASSVTDGDTTHVPTGDAVFDFAKPKRTYTITKNTIDGKAVALLFTCVAVGYRKATVILNICENDGVPCGILLIRLARSNSGAGSLNFMSARFLGTPASAHNPEVSLYYSVDTTTYTYSFYLSTGNNDPVVEFITTNNVSVNSSGSTPASSLTLTALNAGIPIIIPTSNFAPVAVGSASQPVYIDNNGQVQPCYVGRQTTSFAGTKGYLKIAEFTVTNTTNVNTWYKVNLKFVSGVVGDIIYERTMFFNKRSSNNTVYYKESHSPISGSPTIQLQLYATSSTKVTLYAYIASETWYSIMVSDVEGGGWNTFYSGEELSSNVTLYNNETPSSTTPSGTLITPTT